MAHRIDLIAEIEQDLRDGKGFLPFVGAGFSAPSGVPLIVELTQYLHRCICIVLQVDRAEDDDHRNFQRWNPRTDQWPPLVSRGHLVQTGYWEKKLFDQTQDLRLKVEQLRKEWSPALRETEDRLKLFSEAYGAMQDWRTALLFLSRLEVPPRTTTPDSRPPKLTPPRPEVTDACFQEVLRGRYPTLGHRMLASLTDALRLDLILTTNFDDLLERAFDASRNPLQVFEVPNNGVLPRRSSLTGGRSIVKLHGGKTSLKADYSLDETPGEQDVERFISYLAAQYAKRDDPTIKLSASKNLLMLGFSGKDGRINDLVKRALTRLDGLKVYWIYFSENDLRELEREYGPFISEGTILLARCTNIGFLLLELYQSMRSTLPPLGSIFPAASRLTLPPETPDVVVEQILNAFDPPTGQSSGIGEETPSPAKANLSSVRFAKDLEASIWETGGTRSKVILACSADQVPGLTSLCAATFQKVDVASDHMTIWIDMNNVSSADHLFEILLEAVYYRLGVEEWIPSTSDDGDLGGGLYRQRAKELVRLLTSVNKRWVIFLNCRETPGANTYEKSDEEQKDLRNGWIALRENPRTASACLDHFVSMIEEICDQNPPLAFVLMVTDQQSRNQSAPVAQLSKWRNVHCKKISLTKLPGGPEPNRARLRKGRGGVPPMGEVPYPCA